MRIGGLAGWLLAVWMLPDSAAAIVMRHDVPDAAYRALAEDIDVSVTFVRIRAERTLVSGEGTHIGGGWVLTAAHVADPLGQGHHALIGGDRYRLASVIVHPRWRRGRLANDVALVRLDRVPTARARLFSGVESVGLEAVFVGRGDSGDGESGVLRADGVRRAARNVLAGFDGEWLQFVFDAPGRGLPLEGISGPGDSGGPALIGRPGDWIVVGVSCWQDTRPGGGREGRYGVVEHYARVSVHREWIDKVIREAGHD